MFLWGSVLTLTQVIHVDVLVLQSRLGVLIHPLSGAVSHIQSSSDFPAECRRAADRYIIRGSEVYIYRSSDAISAVIRLPLPSVTPCPVSPLRFRLDDYAVEVKLNDYLDIVCPHYPQGEVPLLDAERYVLYMVEREDYDTCKPQSYDQMRWECSHPFSPHAPEKFSEKFQRFTPFTLGKEFRQGESYYYICECLCVTSCYPR